MSGAVDRIAGAAGERVGFPPATTVLRDGTRLLFSYGSYGPMIWVLQHHDLMMLNEKWQQYHRDSLKARIFLSLLDLRLEPEFVIYS